VRDGAIERLRRLVESAEPLVHHGEVVEDLDRRVRIGIEDTAVRRDGGLAVERNGLVVEGLELGSLQIAQPVSVPHRPLHGVDDEGPSAALVSVDDGERPVRHGERRVDRHRLPVEGDRLIRLTHVVVGDAPLDVFLERGEGRGRHGGEPRARVHVAERLAGPLAEPT